MNYMLIFPLSLFRNTKESLRRAFVFVMPFDRWWQGREKLHYLYTCDETHSMDKVIIKSYFEKDIEYRSYFFWKYCHSILRIYQSKNIFSFSWRRNPIRKKMLWKNSIDTTKKIILGPFFFLPKMLICFVGVVEKDFGDYWRK